MEGLEWLSHLYLFKLLPRPGAPFALAELCRSSQQAVQTNSSASLESLPARLLCSSANGLGTLFLKAAFGVLLTSLATLKPLVITLTHWDRASSSVEHVAALQGNALSTYRKLKSAFSSNPPAR